MKIQAADLINKGFWGTLDWIYPPECASCGEPGFRLCADCFEKIKFIKEKCCLICGEPMRTAVECCPDCRANPRSYTAIRNLAEYTGVIRDCVHALKYERNIGMGAVFSDPLAALVVESGWLPDLGMPVPLSRQRLTERGYNQAAYIARPLSARLGIRYHPFGIERTRDTPSQVGLSGEARRRNVAGAFRSVPEIVSSKRVLVVDDVMTTGSTMEACARALIDAGAEAVYCLTLGRFVMQAGVTHPGRHQV